MESLWTRPGANVDSLPPPDGLDRYAILRSLDQERLAEDAPDVPLERRRRITRLRDEIRRGRLETDDRLRIAIARAILEAKRALTPRAPRRRT